MRTAYKHFIILHETRHINGPLADVYLDRARKGLEFYITPKVRNDRRRIWLATVTIQKEYRKKSQRRRYLYFRRCLVRLQAQVRRMQANSPTVQPLMDISYCLPPLGPDVV